MGKSSQLSPARGFRSGMPVWGIVLILVLVAGLLASIGWGYFKSKPGVLALGARVPDFSLTSFDGEEISLAGMQGKTVLIHFWASWCSTCAEETAILEKAWQDNASNGQVVFIGVDYMDSRTEALKALQKYPQTYLNGPDTDSKISAIFHVTGVPETYVIGADGTLKGIKIGPFSSEEEVQEFLKE